MDDCCIHFVHISHIIWFRTFGVRNRYAFSVTIVLIIIVINYICIHVDNEIVFIGCVFVNNNEQWYICIARVYDLLTFHVPIIHHIYFQSVNNRNSHVVCSYSKPTVLCDGFFNEFEPRNLVSCQTYVPLIVRVVLSLMGNPVNRNDPDTNCRSDLCEESSHRNHYCRL